MTGQVGQAQVHWLTRLDVLSDPHLADRMCSYRYLIRVRPTVDPVQPFLQPP
jgi:hypothetical protein